MRVATFNGFTDETPKHVDCTGFSDFSARIIGTKHKHFTAGKHQTPSFSPAEFEPDAPRQDAYVLRVWLAVLDYDHITADQLEQIRACARQYRSLVYSSYTHLGDGPQDNRIRVIFDITRPVLPHEWGGFWDRLTAAIPVPVDRKCRNLSRIYSLNYTPNVDQAILEFYEGNGVLNVEDVLKLPAPVRQVTDKGDELDVSQPVTLADLKEHAARLKKSTRGPRAAENQTRARWFEQLANGLPFALEASRHNTYLKLTAYLEHVFPHSPCEAIADLFAQSLKAMSGPDFDPGREQLEVLRATRTMRERRLTEVSAAAAARDVDQSSAIRAAFRPLGVDRDTPYTREEIEKWAAEAGTSIADFRRQWIVKHGHACYVRVGGEYLPPVQQGDLLVSLRRDLAPAMGDAGGVTLTKINPQTGATVRKTQDEVLVDYATAARGAVAWLGETQTTYDPETQTINEAVCRPRRLEPTRSEAVEEWLSLLAGNNLEQLLLWLHEFPDLTHPLAALYLEGPPGTGKSLMGHGLSRIWGLNGPVKASELVSEFNEALLYNPLVFADEAMPVVWLGKDGLGRFRDHVQERSRMLNRKNISRIPMNGAYRTILAANNLELLGARLQLTANDRSAILERVFHLETSEAAARYLRRLGEERCMRFILDDELAKHCLWIRATMPLQRQGRFGVPPLQTRLHDEMRGEHPVNSAVGQWLVRFVLDKRPPRVEPGGLPLIFVRGLNLHVNVQALDQQQRWESYVSAPRDVPPPRAIGKALVELAERRTKIGDVNYYVITPDSLHTFAEQVGVTLEAINAGLAYREAQDAARKAVRAQN